MKKGLVLICAFLMIFSFTVSAESKVSLTPDGEFLTETEKIAEIFGQEKNELLDFCIENDIIYIAVNEDNSKQIRATCKQTDFSNNIVNMNGLSNDKITALLPDIIGIENARGDIIDKNGQKFIKVALRSNDSGGDYLLTEYITVADRKVFVLSFYTDANTDTDYIEKTFESYTSPYFVNDNAGGNNTLQHIILAAIIIFVIASVIIVLTIIKDLKKNKEKAA